MRTFGCVPFIIRRSSSGFAALLLTSVAISVMALARTGPAGAQDGALRVSVSADPPSPQVGDTVVLTAEISGAPSGGTPNYKWDACIDGFCMNLKMFASLRHVTAPPC